jgi:hypothetical protein
MFIFLLNLEANLNLLHDMTKFTAIVLWPIVYVLDIGIAITGAQTFKEARVASRRKLAKILNKKEFSEDYSTSNNTFVPIDDSPHTTDMRDTK